ncbi:hypothetical protein G5V59_22200 [Nocardioides sp. W3-2-3]|nr:hypothetical protein [Nocardioides convexus]NHA01579.1 hypothetical protein [Nocardioides convexus]
MDTDGDFQFDQTRRVRRGGRRRHQDRPRRRQAGRPPPASVPTATRST